MPPPKDHAKSVTVAVEGLVHAVTDLVSSVQGAIARGSEVKRAAVQVGEAAGLKSAKLKRSLKSYWSKLRGKAREARIRKMLAGRGLEPKAKGKARGAPRKTKSRGRRGARR